TRAWQVRPLGCPESIRGLQLGEEQAPLISPPDSRRPETAYASYSRRLLNAGRGFLQIVARQIFRKYLIHRGKSVVFISWKPFLSTARITRRATRAPNQGSSSVAAVAGRGSCWQRQELVILVSALAQSVLNFAFVAAASDKFFFCARRLLANP